MLHTDEPHPHVHAVVKAVSEQGVRLNIRKTTLREWRAKFARHLREQGIEANATEQAVRGQNRMHKLDGIYRAAHRGASTHMRDRAQVVARELHEGNLQTEPGRSKLTVTRNAVERGWHAASGILRSEGRVELATQVQQFLDQMPPARTEKEVLARELLSRVHAPAVTVKPMTR